MYYVKGSLSNLIKEMGINPLISKEINLILLPSASAV